MVQEGAQASLTDWASFYVIVGSSAAALTGLQFVVMALVSETRARRNMSTISAFGTPTVVHFCAVLLVSATLCAPWQALSGAAYFLGLYGIAGVVYAVLVTLRARRQTGYVPVVEDWVWHSALPFAAYAAVLISALLLVSHERVATFMTGGAVLLLLFIGIHNSWDTVTYIVMEHERDRDTEPND